jgi:hypothetical protein
MQRYWTTNTRLTINQNGKLTIINSITSPEAKRIYTATQRSKNP